MNLDKQLFSELTDKINCGDAVALQDLMKRNSVQPDAHDDHGMTLLQHAAFKGNRDMCQLLIDLGANPNRGNHEHKYSTLHFAALSGNVEVCQLLLEHGADISTVNSVGRTPAQMAGFVGNHQCVSTINNFIPKQNIEFYTIDRDSGKAKLPRAVAPALHRLVLQVNLHPVHLLLVIQKLPLLWENASRVKEVLDLLCESQMKPGTENNEILSIKYHHLSFVVASLATELKKKDTAPDAFGNLLRSLLKTRTSDNFPEYLDNYVRESIRTFPFKTTTIFRQLLLNLASDKRDSSPAISLLNTMVNGQRGFHDDTSCSTCFEDKAPKKCSSCRKVQYCDRDCQKLHWPFHKKQCDSLAKKTAS